MTHEVMLSKTKNLMQFSLYKDMKDVVTSNLKYRISNYLLLPYTPQPLSRGD